MQLAVLAFIFALIAFLCSLGTFISEVKAIRALLEVKKEFLVNDIESWSKRLTELHDKFKKLEEGINHRSEAVK